MHLNKPIVGMAATPDGGGYWLVASDGGIFSLRRCAVLRLRPVNIRLAQPIVGMAAMPDGGGYWFTAADGGLFNYGDAPFYGSRAGTGHRPRWSAWRPMGPRPCRPIFDIPALRPHLAPRTGSASVRSRNSPEPRYFAGA